MELKKILLESLVSKDTYKTLKRLDNDGILQQIIPKISDMKSVGECKYHVLNCFDHSLKALEELEEIVKVENQFPSHLQGHVNNYLETTIEKGITKFHILKLGVFLHDIGKYESRTVDDTGRVHFANHEKIGADIARDLCLTLDLSTEISNIVYNYVRYHMVLLGFYKKNNIEKEELFDIFRVLGDDIIGVIMLGYADIVATRKLLNPNEDMGVIKTYMEYVLTNYLYRYLKN